MDGAGVVAGNYGSGTEKEALEYINGKTDQDTFSEFVEWQSAKEGRDAK